MSGKFLQAFLDAKWSLFVLLLMSPVEKGVLRIQSEPRAEVIWEGVRVGWTDSTGILTIRDVPTGVFSITLSKPGFKEFTTRVEVIADEKAVVVKLEPLEEEGRTIKNPDVPVQLLSKPPPSLRERRPGSRQPAGPAPSDGQSRRTPTASIYVLALVLLVAAIFCYGKYRARAVPLPAAIQVPRYADAFGSAEASGAQPSDAWEDPPQDFLEDLQKREKMSQHTVEVKLNRRPVRVIDIDPVDVEQIEEKP